MKDNKRTFVIVGLILGLLCGVAVFITAYTQAPSPPGMFELFIQILILGILGAIGSALGLIVTIVMGLFRNKQRGTERKQD